MWPILVGTASIFTAPAAKESILRADNVAAVHAHCISDKCALKGRHNAMLANHKEFKAVESSRYDLRADGTDRAKARRAAAQDCPESSESDTSSSGCNTDLPSESQANLIDTKLHPLQVVRALAYRPDLTIR